MEKSTWIFIFSTNKSMTNNIGKPVQLAMPTRRDTGERVLYAHEPGNRGNWYFYTTPIDHIDREMDITGGIEKISVHTRNSVYRFYKNVF